jgi:hypothetical protein
MEPTHMALSAFDWATVLAMAGLLWFLFVRDYKSRDRQTNAVEALSVEVGRLRAWMAETYVTKVEHLREVDRLETSIADHAERWREDLTRHRSDCPVRRP